MNTNAASFVDVSSDMDEKCFKSRLNSYSKSSYPVQILPKTPTCGTNIMRLVEDQLLADINETAATSVTLLDPTIYKSQQAHIIDIKFQKKLENRIDELSKLLPNWDGYNAKEILSQNKTFAISFLRKILSKLVIRTQIVSKFEVFPTIEGGYQFEIRIDNREIEIEYSPVEKIFDVLFVEISEEQEIYQEDRIEKGKSELLIDRVINWLMAENV